MCFMNTCFYIYYSSLCRDLFVVDVVRHFSRGHTRTFGVVGQCYYRCTPAYDRFGTFKTWSIHKRKILKRWCDFYWFSGRYKLLVCVTF